MLIGLSGTIALRRRCFLAASGYPSASAENSDGLDPDYCCRGAVVRWRRVLGSATRRLVKLTDDEGVIIRLR